MTSSVRDRVEVTTELLRQAARDAEMWITGDGRVGEADAAALLGIEPETLAKKRQEGKAPPSYKLPAGGARVSYRLSDMAAWVEGHRENF